MAIEVKSFFDKAHWRDSSLERFKSLVQPKNEAELQKMLETMENGECVLSAVGTFKFRRKQLGDTK